MAFGTHVGVPDPANFRADCDYIGTRLAADPSAAFVAEADGEVIGSNFATNWGSVGFFGPLTVRPDLWGQGVAQRLMEPVMQRFAAWNTRHAGLYTFANSIKHVHLYRKYGFWPGHLTAIVSRPVQSGGSAVAWQGCSRLTEEDGTALRTELARMTDAIYPGLCVDREILEVRRQGLGETVLVSDGDGPAAFGVCHCGAGTEAGTGSLYIKFGAARPGAGVERRFADLLLACEELAAEQGLSRLVAGVSMGRREATQMLLELGFRVDIQGVAMHRPGPPGYSAAGVFVLDDWR